MLFNEAAQQNGINIEPDFETNYSSAAYSMVKLGLGIALLDPFTAILQRTNEVKILQFSPAIPFKAAILRPDHRPSTPAIDALIELIKTVKNDVLAEIAK